MPGYAEQKEKGKEDARARLERIKPGLGGLFDGGVESSDLQAQQVRADEARARAKVEGKKGKVRQEGGNNSSKDSVSSGTEGHDTSPRMLERDRRKLQQLDTERDD